jgi:hypothetical protein
VRCRGKAERAPRRLRWSGGGEWIVLDTDEMVNKTEDRLANWQLSGLCFEELLVSFVGRFSVSCVERFLN